MNGWDELTHFSKTQFQYLTTRQRTDANIETRTLGTCNPDPDSWVKEVVEWWLDKEGQYADFSKSGIIRWFFVDEESDEWVWFNSLDEIVTKYGKLQGRRSKSFTFIPARLTDNKIGLKDNPRYEANLSMQDKVTRKRLRDGDWKIKAAPGIYFRKDDFEEVETYPQLVQIVRFWDLAATEVKKGSALDIKTRDTKSNKGGPDYTVSVKMGMTSDKEFYIIGLSSMRVSPLKVERAIKNTAAQDTTRVKVMTYQDPGQAGKSAADRWRRMMSKYECATILARTDKETNCKSFSAASEFGNVKVWKGIPKKERDLFYSMLQSFPDSTVHDDFVDAASSAYNDLNDAAQVWAF